MLTIYLVTSSITITAPLSPLATSLYTAIYVFVMLVAPGLLIWAQKYKKYVLVWLYLILSETLIPCVHSEVRGTWDPAVPKVKFTH